MKKTVGTTALMLIAGPLSALVLAALLDVVLPLSSGLLPQPSGADMGPELPDSVLWLWVPGLFLLNAVIVVPISWGSFLSSRHPRVLCFGAVLIAALVVSAMLASDAPASGNRIQSFVGGVRGFLIGHVRHGCCRHVHLVAQVGAFRITSGCT